MINQSRHILLSHLSDFCKDESLILASIVSTIKETLSESMGDIGASDGITRSWWRREASILGPSTSFSSQERADHGKSIFIQSINRTEQMRTF